ncbi:MAG: hypothetical protein IPO88_08005 [Nannocystis sp.]|jgi:hypothetical protein|uniref:IS66 family insertion sequence element accessory protein TnpA n=1 Tax=Nannocystis sp. TaxID=1962667 RepID=UPI002429579F|nr:hypothetical protein [Nannocystis sp.]MBK9753435.1 hypothetical protein [Nannocystis sp.]
MTAATEDRWRAHVRAWSASGQTCKGYAATAQINPRTLTWWKSKLAAAGPAPSFVEVTDPGTPTTAADDGVIELEVGNTRIRVRGRVEPEALVRVLAAVEGRR